MKVLLTFLLDAFRSILPRYRFQFGAELASAAQPAGDDDDDEKEEAAIGFRVPQDDEALDEEDAAD